MKVDDEMIRYTVETLLGTAAATLTVYLWFFNLVANQRAFGAMLGSGLVIFAMMIYAYYKPSLTGSGNSWLLAGCVTAAVFLLLAVQLTAQ
ncbi:MAG TPA: hypothetical protein VEC08_05305 [Nitrososphaerales archaeon]|nr:hypothetical protein [Nitrososphaerales archaeon]